MDNIWSAIILSVVEGLTEFLPVSSTGHLIIVGDLLSFTGKKASVFEVFIQLGAILAVVVLYWDRFIGLLRPRADRRFSGLYGIWLLILTCIPACVLGLIFHHDIKEYLFTPKTVVFALIVGAIMMIVVEKMKFRESCRTLDELTPKLAFGIGCFQCLALWPGFSRSAATIMGGMILGARRPVAADYSFIAAVPIMVAATGFDLLKSWSLFSTDDLLILGIGFVGAFISALLAVKAFVAVVGRVTLVPFAVYRLILAPVVFYFLCR